LEGPLPEFLSDEDADLANLSDEELWAWWDAWFRAAQASNEDDAHVYSHGVLVVEPGYEHLLDDAIHAV
jgi:hypothetical protein